MIETGFKFMLGCMLGWAMIQMAYYLILFLIFIIGEGLEKLNERIRRK